MQRTIVAALALLSSATAMQAQNTSATAVPVTVTNFTRAETDMYFGGMVKDGALGKFTHRREPANVDKQDVIRMNRDTLYSVTRCSTSMPGRSQSPCRTPGKRFMSMMIVDEDHYVPSVFYGAGSHTLTRDNIGTRYVMRSGAHAGRSRGPERRRSRSTRFRTRSRRARKTSANSKCRTGITPVRRRCAMRFSSSTPRSPISRMRSEPEARSIRSCT